MNNEQAFKIVEAIDRQTAAMEKIAAAVAAGLKEIDTSLMMAWTEAVERRL